MAKRFHRGGKPPTPKPAPPPRATKRIPKPPAPKPPPSPKPQPQPAPKPSPAPAPPSALDILKGNILQLLGAADANSVETRAAVGGMFREIRDDILPPGAFRSWVRKELPFKPRTAQRSIDLCAFKEREPALFDKLRPLGLAKAYVLITYPPARIASIVNSAHLVPSSNHHKTPAQMDQDEMLEVIAALANKSTDPYARLAKRFRRRCNALVKDIGDLIAAGPNIDPDDLDDVYHKAIVALARLERTFKLDRAR